MERKVFINEKALKIMWYDAIKQSLIYLKIILRIIFRIIIVIRILIRV